MRVYKRLKVVELSSRGYTVRAPATRFNVWQQRSTREREELAQLRRAALAILLLLVLVVPTMGWGMMWPGMMGGY